jgi:tetratricopeptide (TPR) repeat protein
MIKRKLTFYFVALMIFSTATNLIAGAQPARGDEETGRPDVPPAARFLAQAKTLYALRADLSSVQEAIKVMSEAKDLEPANYDVNWQLAKYTYYLASHTADKAQRSAALRQGIAAGEAAVKLHPERPEGHFWLGANLGEKAKGQGALRALGTVGDVRREMEAVLKIDEGYQDGSVYMVLGQIDLELPGLVGGDKKRAVERLEKGLAFGKQNAFLRLRLARAYQSVGRKEDARKQLDAILAMKPHPDYLPEYKEASAEARRLMEKGF